MERIVKIGKEEAILIDMQSVQMGISVPPTSINIKLNLNCKKQSFLRPSCSSSRVSLEPPLHQFSKSGICKASQGVELSPTLSSEIVVREARLEDCWDVAETHCSSFFPESPFPLDFVLRIDRMVATLAGLSLPNVRRRTCLVAVVGGSVDQTFSLGSQHLRAGVFDGIFSLNRECVTGILTVDTLARFLPRKGPLRQRRTGIAYISNVAVRERFRRKGIAKRLIAKAEGLARSWGCRAIALHCDLNDPSATKLYRDQGFKCIKVPDGANWPHPNTSPDVKFTFMMKLIKYPT